MEKCLQWTRYEGETFEKTMGIVVGAPAVSGDQHCFKWNPFKLRTILATCSASTAPWLNPKMA